MDSPLTEVTPSWQKIIIFFALFCQSNSATFNDGVRSKFTATSLLTKVQLTQKGYIQFLRYVEDIPSITEYTFCIWIKSNDLSHSHPLLSYSKNETERLIRVWISPSGILLNLELYGQPVFEIPTVIREHQWYHICQSWYSGTATWELFINEQKFRGHAPQLSGLIIEPGGDLVVAQEYTDFNKGLEDGIEGDIFGFNFVLSATSKSTKHETYLQSPSRYFSGYRQRRSFAPSRSRISPFYLYNPIGKLPTFSTFLVPRKNSFMSAFGGVHHNDVFPPRTPASGLPINTSNRIKIKDINELFPTYFSADDIPGIEKRKSTGFMLVELSKKCWIGKGGPLRGKDVLINWTDTKVRVFGGAIMKHVKPFC